MEPLVFEETDGAPTRPELEVVSSLQLLSVESDPGLLGATGPERIESLFRDLRATYLSTVQTLAYLVESKDAYTAHHLERCRRYATALAAQIDASLATEEVQHGYLLHDIGKIGIPDAILTKPGPLTAREAAIMRTHPGLGTQIVEPMRCLDVRAIEVVRFHHERFDGRGYPARLRGTDIPLAARIFTVVDAYDAMTSHRPYRRALTRGQAVAELIAGAGTQFDPDVVGTFVAIVPELPTFSPPPVLRRFGARPKEAAGGNRRTAEPRPSIGT